MENYYGMNGMNQQYYGAYYGQPVVYNTVPTPQNRPSLTAEEVKMIQQQNPSKIDISVSPQDNLRAMCNHKSATDGRDLVVQLSDGTNDVFCPQCSYRWNADNLSKEEVKEICDRLISAMQNAKWVGDYGVELVRDYFPMIPLIEKFPDLYEYAMKQFNKYVNANGYGNANDAAIYNQYNSLMGYQNAPMNYGYTNAYPQMNQQYVQPQYNNVYAQQPQQNPYQPAPATNVNPMQAPMGQPQTYTQPQYTYQAPMMGQPQMQMQYQAPIQPTPGVPQGYMPAAAQPANPQEPVISEDPKTGTTKSENTVKLS